MLISSLVGVASRMTMDFDAAITGFVLTHKLCAALSRSALYELIHAYMGVSKMS